LHHVSTRFPASAPGGADLRGGNVHRLSHLFERQTKPRIKKTRLDFSDWVATGSGIWATHFVAMLAFKTGLATAYDPILTLASLLIAVGVTAAGFFLAVQGTSRWMPALGGAVIGMGIAAIHYTGMRAFTTTGTVGWDESIVVASIALGVVIASAALVSFHRMSGPWAAWSAAGLLTIAICSLHFFSSENCTEVQGYYFGRPTSAKDIRTVLMSGRIDVDVIARDLRAREAVRFVDDKVTPIEGATRKRRRRPSAA
jgi:NO-binding membrane sensor protein with MHYT domain